MGIEEVEILWRGGKHRHNPSSKRGQSKLFLSLLIPVGMNEEISFVCSLQSELRLCWVSLFLYVLVSYFIRLSLERLRLPLLWGTCCAGWFTIIKHLFWSISVQSGHSVPDWFWRINLPCQSQVCDCKTCAIVGKRRKGRSGEGVDVFMVVSFKILPSAVCLCNSQILPTALLLTISHIYLWVLNVLFSTFQIDLRDDPKTIAKLNDMKEKPIATEQGQKLAKEVRM